MKPINLFLLTVISLYSSLVSAEQRVYEVDKFGSTQYHKPGFTIQDNGRVIPTDQWGRKQYHEPQYVIKGDKLLPVDSYGNRRIELQSNK